LQGSKKSAVRSSGTGRFSFWARNFSLSLAQWARDQASHLPIKSSKEQPKTCPGQAGIKVFSSPVLYHINFKLSNNNNK